MCIVAKPNNKQVKQVTQTCEAIQSITDRPVAKVK